MRRRGIGATVAVRTSHGRGRFVGAGFGMTSAESGLRREVGLQSKRNESWKGQEWRERGGRDGVQPADIRPFDANVRRPAGCWWGVEVTNPLPRLMVTACDRWEGFLPGDGGAGLHRRY